MTTYKDTDLREALRRKYADTPQLPSDFMNRMQQASQKKRQRSSFFILHSPLAIRRFAAVFSIAAVLLIAFLLWPESHKDTSTQPEMQPVVAEANPQPIPPPVIEEEKEEVLAEVQAPKQPVKKRKKAVRKQSTSIEEPVEEIMPAEPVVAQAMPMPEQGEDPIEKAARIRRELRQRGEQVEQYVAMLNERVKQEQYYMEY